MRDPWWRSPSWKGGEGAGVRRCRCKVTVDGILYESYGAVESGDAIDVEAEMSDMVISPRI